LTRWACKRIGVFAPSSKLNVSRLIKKKWKYAQVSAEKSGSRHRGCYATIFAASTARSSSEPVREAGIAFKALVIIQNLPSVSFQLNRN
jgi:hypothetical protein